MPEPTKTATEDAAFDESIPADPETVSLDDVFDVSADDAGSPDEQGQAGDDGAARSDAQPGGDESADGDGDDPTKQPQSPDEPTEPAQPAKVKVKHRGQEFEIPADQAPLFQALTTDYAEATRKITELSAAKPADKSDDPPAQPSETPDQVKARRKALFDEIDADLKPALDDPENRGLAEKIVGLVHRATSGTSKQIDAAIKAALETFAAERLAPIQQILSSPGIREQADTAKAEELLAQDLPLYGAKVGDVGAQDVMPIYRELSQAELGKPEAERISPREIWTAAVVRALRGSKAKAGPSDSPPPPASPPTNGNGNGAPATRTPPAAPHRQAVAPGGGLPRGSEPDGVIHPWDVDPNEM